MKKPATISRTEPASLGQNFAKLLAQGIEYCQQMSEDNWTDYNEHDPGLTLLEQLCYAITDLSARTGQKICDLLTPCPGQSDASSEDTLYTGDKALSCQALSADDYRKLLYDCVPGLKNAWLRPCKGAAGRYEILVEAYARSDPTKVKACIKEVMCSNRNVAEDIERVVLLKPYPIALRGTIEIGSRADPVEVLADVLFALQNYLSPFPKVHMVDELLHVGTSPDEIFVGPRLNLGVLDNKQLSPYKQTITLQGLVEVILKVPGVEGVHNMCLPGQQTTITLPCDSVPDLEPSIFTPPEKAYGINVERVGGVSQPLKTELVYRSIEKRLGEIGNHETYAKRSLQNMEYGKVPVGKYLDVSSYFSIQHQFPLTYGISRYGIVHYSPALESIKNVNQIHIKQMHRTKRQALARQLKAYLLFFEQLLANYLAQLAQARRLFSLDEKLEQSYFSQPLVDIPARERDAPNILEIFRYPEAEAEKSSKYSVYVIDELEEIQLNSADLPDKERALARKREISKYGQIADFYRAESCGPMEYRLVLHNASHQPIAYGQERFALAEHAKQDAQRLADFLAKLSAKPSALDNYIKLSRFGRFAVRLLDEAARIVLDSRDLPSLDSRNKRVEDMLEYGVLPENYQIHAIDKAWYRVVLVNAEHKTIAYGAVRFESVASAEQGIATLVDWLKRLRFNLLLQKQFIQCLPVALNRDLQQLTYYQQKLALTVKQFDPFLERRNRFLDHLLARFGERFDNHLLRHLDPRVQNNPEEFDRELIRWKTIFLCQIIELGSGRAKGTDYTAWQKSLLPEPTGLEKRLWLLLGLHGHFNGTSYLTSKRALTNDDPPFHYRATNGKPAHPRSQAADDDELLGILNRRQFFVFTSTNPAVISNMFEHGLDRRNYQIVPGAVEGTVSLNFTWPGEEQSLEVHRTYSWEAAEQARDGLIKYLHHLTHDVRRLYQDEGLYVLEHLLLRPTSSTDSSQEKDASQRFTDDFYANRISILLPNWPVRFQREEFKLFVERVVYENCPAHISAQCYWLSYPQMAQFERLYAYWTELKGKAAHTIAAPSDELEAAAQALRIFMMQLERTLNAC